MFLSTINWMDLLTGIGIAAVVLVPTGIVVFKKAKKGWDEKGAAGVVGVLTENHKFFSDVYTQLKGVVKAVGVKEEAVNDLLANISDEDKDKLRKVSKSLSGATLDGASLPSIDVAGLAFKDIVNNKLIKEDAINDKILKSLVTSAKEDKDASEALNKVAGIVGAVAGEGLNLGARVATGGTVDVKAIMGFVSGVGSTALGAKKRE